MKRTLFATLIATGLFVSAGAAFAAGDAANGETLSAPCAACHGADGNSPSPMFPKLAGLGERYLYQQLQAIQAGGDVDGGRSVPEMAGQLDGMSGQSLQDLAAFYASNVTQLAGATDAELKLNSGVKVSALALGEQVFRAGNLETHVPACTGCHSPRGLGNEPAGFPRLSGQHADYIEKQLFAFRKGDRASDGDTRIMRSVAQHMSDAEIKAVAAYISGLN